MRATHNRCLPDGEKLWSPTCDGEAMGEITFAMASRHGIKARMVKQQLWSRQIDLPDGKRGTIPVTCIIAREVDALQLSGIDRLERALALFMVVAWRIARLMRLGRTCPDVDATLFFDPDEIRGVCLLTRTKQPAVSSLNNVLRLVARLGGFPGRKGDGHPGVKAIWEGLQKVQVAAESLQGMRFEES